MGQYYKGIILKSHWRDDSDPIRAALSPMDFDNGMKLTEHSYIGNNFVNAMICLIHKLDQDHTGVPVVWEGDYADTIIHSDMTLYDCASDWIDRDKHSVISLIYEGGNIDLLMDLPEMTFAINHTKKEIVKFPKYDPSKLTIHPLPILLADGNGMGGGDYYGKNKSLAGTWKFDLISVTDDSAMVKSLVDQGYKMIKWKKEYENY